jgi:hypothetical protein
MPKITKTNKENKVAADKKIKGLLRRFFGKDASADYLSVVDELNRLDTKNGLLGGIVAERLAEKQRCREEDHQSNVLALALGLESLFGAHFPAEAIDIQPPEHLNDILCNYTQTEPNLVFRDELIREKEINPSSRIECASDNTTTSTAR